MLNKNKNKNMGTLLIPHEKVRGEKPLDSEQRVNHKTSRQLVKYLTKGENFSMSEINELIVLLQRSTMSAQKRKRKLVENAMKKMKKSSKRN